MREKFQLWDDIKSRLSEDPGYTIMIDEPERKTSFAEFWELSGRTYHYLKQQGITYEDVVAVHMPRSAEIFAAVTGVLRAGAAYVICESDAVGERSKFILKDCDYKIMIDEAVWKAILKTSPIDGAEPVDLHDKAFIAYSSGTAGTPKGAIHEYGTIMLQAKKSRFGRAVIPVMHTLDFISSTILFIKAIGSGHTLAIVPNRCKENPELLVSYLKKTGTTRGYLTPSYLRRNGMPDLGWKIVGLGSEPADGLKPDGIESFNMYASTESGVTLSVHRITEKRSPMPIGSATEHIKVLREDGTEAFPGETGELCYHQPYFRGYQHLPEKTAKAKRGGWVHSGDRAVLLSDGNIALTGRLDEQFKIDGNMIVPKDIENAISSALGIKNVIVRGFVFKDIHSICAFYTDTVDIHQKEAQEALLKLIPMYMVPTNYYRLQEFPLLPTGKVNKTALVPPEGDWKQFHTEAICEIPLIAKGRTAEIYRFGEKKAIKLFRKNYPLSLIANECHSGCEAQALGLSGINTYSIVRTQGCYGIMTEFFEGKTFEQELEENFDRCEELMGRYVQAVRGMHSIHDKEGKLRNTKQTLCDFISRVIEKTDKNHGDLIQKVLDHIPDRDTMVQLDSHIGNCFVSDDKAVFFDFAYLGHGHPIFDLSSMYAHMIFWPSTDKSKKLSAEQYRKAFDLFLSKYLGTQNKDILKNAERQLRFVRILMTVFSAAMAPGMYSEGMIKDAVLQLGEDADWFVQQNLIE